MHFVENGELIRVNGNKPKEEVAKEILSIVLDYLEKNNETLSEV